LAIIIPEITTLNTTMHTHRIDLFRSPKVLIVTEK
jgi:hypothetical protein